MHSLSSTISLVPGVREKAGRNLILDKAQEGRKALFDPGRPLVRVEGDALSVAGHPGTNKLCFPCRTQITIDGYVLSYNCMHRILFKHYVVCPLEVVSPPTRTTSALGHLSKTQAANPHTTAAAENTAVEAGVVVSPRPGPESSPATADPR